MENSKYLSIIIPVYNVERYIQKCLETINTKNYSEQVEIILVDDGSTDNSGMLCDMAARENSNIVAYHKKNGGLSDARNYGLQKASGKYVFFYDSDDFVLDNFIDRIFSVINSADIDVLLWDADIYDDNGKYIENSSKYYYHYGLKENIEYSGQDVIEKQLVDHNDYVTTVWLGLYSRRMLLVNNLWFEKELLHEDEMWTQKVLLTAKSVKYISEPLYCYRKRSNSIMNQIDKNYSKNVSSLIYIFSTLYSYYEWKIKDENFLKLIKGNTSKRYLHMIGKYQVIKYPEQVKKINRLQIFKNSLTIKDKSRALLLCSSMKLYCLLMKNRK